ncbi:MAG: hypothetical protein OXH96_12285, partial [Spirochaetaceae bacterium]|nr:hypothetical protein [Spirochaetaceae bacterium]
AEVDPELAQPSDRMRALAGGRWELKAAVDAECRHGLEKLQMLLSHRDPHLTLGGLVARLVRDGLHRYDPERPPEVAASGRGRLRRRRANAEQAGAARFGDSAAERGAREGPRCRTAERNRAGRHAVGGRWGWRSPSFGADTASGGRARQRDAGGGAGYCPRHRVGGEAPLGGRAWQRFACGGTEQRRAPPFAGEAPLGHRARQRVTGGGTE